MVLFRPAVLRAPNETVLEIVNSPSSTKWTTRGPYPIPTEGTGMEVALIEFQSRLHRKEVGEGIPVKLQSRTHRRRGGGRGEDLYRVPFPFLIEGRRERTPFNPVPIEVWIQHGVDYYSRRAQKILGITNTENLPYISPADSVFSSKNEIQECLWNEVGIVGYPRSGGRPNSLHLDKWI